MKVKNLQNRKKKKSRKAEIKERKKCMRTNKHCFSVRSKLEDEYCQNDQRMQ